MKKPTMIFFDYGETLIHELAFDVTKGNVAMLVYCQGNLPSPKQMAEVGMRMSQYQRNGKSTNYVEIPETHFRQCLLDYFSLKSDLDIESLARVFWDAACPYEKIAGAEDMLYQLMQENIKIGVISNLAMSGDALRQRLKTVYPNIDFDLVITSADYGVRKPEPLLFEIALNRMQVKAEDCFYCGDTYEADIVGARNVGMMPVWFGGSVLKDGIVINKWQELLEGIANSVLQLRGYEEG